MKGAIKNDHIALNKYEFIVLGLPPLTPVTIGGLEEELTTVDLPDKTKASGGTTNTVETEMELPMHHMIEQTAMELWYKQCQDPVSSGYKKDATLIHKSISGSTIKTYSLVGIFITGRATPDLEMDNAGEMANVTWSLSIDDILPI